MLAQSRDVATFSAPEVTGGAPAGYRAGHGRRRPVSRETVAPVLPQGRSRDGRGASQVGLPGVRRGHGALGGPRGRRVLWPRDHLSRAARRGRPARRRVRGEGSAQGRPPGSLPAQLAPVHHRVLRRAEVRRDGHADQPDVHESRGPLPARGQRRARHRLPGHPPRQGGEVRRAARPDRRHQRRRVPSRLEAAPGPGTAGQVLLGPRAGDAPGRARAEPALAAGSLEEVSAPAPERRDRSRRRPRRLAVHRRNHRASEGGHADPSQPGGGADRGGRDLPGPGRGTGSHPRLPALLPHLRPGLDHAEQPRAGAPAGAVHPSRHLRDPHRDGAAPGDRVLRRADALHESTMQGWARRTGSHITEGYGLSETCATSHLNPLGRSKPGSFGCPVPNVLAAVLDPETLEFVPPGQTGELVLSGPNVMRGYWRRPEETERAFVERAGVRWMRTGDIVRMDDEGYFHFYDRAKDLIKYKGHSVFAKDVEDVLYGHPQVKAAGVIGVPDPSVGQRIKAVVVLQTDARGRVSEQEIKAYCRERLADYKVPHVVEFRGEVPKTDVGKVSRRELRDEGTLP